MSACQLCSPRQYTNFLYRVIRASVGSALKHYLDLLDDVPVDKQGIENIRSQKTLRNTGVIWEGMDFAIKLGLTGLVAVATSKVEEYHELFKDAIEELEEWRDGDLFSTDIIANHVPETKPIHEGAKDGLRPDALKPKLNNIEELDDNPFDLPRHASAAILPATKKAIETLKLIRLLYPAMLKRRVKRFPCMNAQTPPDKFPTAEQVDRYDKIMSYCHLFSEEADEIAAALYTHDVDKVNDNLGTIKDYSRQCMAITEKTWDGDEDEFTRWVKTWLVKLDEL